MVIFLSDASPKVGFGHLVRCRTLATEIIAKGSECVMIGPELSYRVEEDKKIFKDWVVFQNWTSVEEAAEKFISLFRKFQGNIAVLDDYRAVNQFQKKLLEAEVKWMQFDYTIEKPLMPHFLINPSPEDFKPSYNVDMKNPAFKFFHGPKYCVLRPEFQKLPHRKNNLEVKNVLLTFGAGDDGGINDFVLENLLKVTQRNVHFHVMNGKFNPRNEALKQWILDHGHDRVTLHVNPPSVSTLFLLCDIGIISGGTTSYEAAACGLPLLIMTVAENQVRQSMAWEQAGVAKFLGRSSEITAEKLVKEYNLLSQNSALRNKMSETALSLVDGQGAKRLADLILEEIK